MPRTISDEEYNQLLRESNIGKMVAPIYDSPQLGTEARALLKKAYPDLQMEGYDLEQRLNGQIANLRKERDEERAAERKKADDAQAEDFKAKRKKTQDEYGFTDEAMGRLEKMMIERNIGNYEDGATVFAAREPRPAEPTPGSGRYWDFEKRDGFAEISKDPEKWGFNQLVAAARRDEERMKNRAF